MRLGAMALVALLVAAPFTSAFCPAPTATTCIHPKFSSLPRAIHRQSFETKRWRSNLVLATESAGGETISPETDLTEAEWAIVKDLFSRANDNATKLEVVIGQALPTMHPKLIMKLRQTSGESSSTEIASVARALQSVLDSSLDSGREMLATLLNAGEIRKLDAEIGKAARVGRLDTAFFTVLNINMQEASAAAAAAAESEKGDATSRTQILQHIYTRCQEEIEKTIPGGVALLNKLLRTQMESIRQNQLEHYLCPQTNVITTPDGKEITLEGKKTVLVPLANFVDAIANAVKQIRTVEQAGGTDRESAANMVETCRQVAKEARIVIAKNYGVESDELQEFEDGLMPVFRPTSQDSPYIQGQ